MLMLASIDVFALSTVPNPLEIADVVINYIPQRDHDLDQVAPYERVIEGHTSKVLKGKDPTTIIHTANTFIRPLQANVPVRLCLKKFADRDTDEYYIIAILPIENVGITK